MFLCCKITPSQSKLLQTTPVCAFCFATLFSVGEGGKGEVLTLEHFGCQWYLQNIAEALQCPFCGFLCKSTSTTASSVAKISLCFFLSDPASTHWTEILIPQTVPLAFDEDLQSWRGCAKFIPLIYHIWGYQWCTSYWIQYQRTGQSAVVYFMCEVNIHDQRVTFGLKRH